MTQSRWLLPCIFMLLSLGLGLFRINSTPLWNDEAFSILTAQQGLHATAQDIVNDYQPPLYYLLLSAWLKVTDQVLWIRFLTILNTAFAAGLVTASARRMFGTAVGATAGILFVLSPVIVDWSQKARPYGLQVFFCALALWAIVRVLAVDLRPGNAGTRGVWRDWGVYALGAAGAMLTQHTAGFFLLALNVGAIVALWTAGRLSWRWLMHCAVGQVVAVAIWSLWLPGFIAQMDRLLMVRMAAASPIPTVFSWKDVIDATVADYVAGHIWRLQVPLLIAYLVLIAIGLYRQRGARPWSVFLAITAFLPLLCALAGYAAIHPIFGYLLVVFTWLPVVVAILLASSIVALPGIWLRAVVLIVLVLVDVRGLTNYYQRGHVPLDRIAALLAQDLRPDDVVIFSTQTGTGCGIRYYLTKQHVALPDGVRQACRHGLEHPTVEHSLKPADVPNGARVWAVTEDGAALMFDPSAPPLAYTKRYDVPVGANHLQRFDP